MSPPNTDANIDIAAQLKFAAAVLHQGRFAEALASYDKALENEPHSAEAWYGHGESLWHLKRYYESLGSFDSALAFDAQHVRAHTGRGRVLALLGRRADALAAFDKALSFDIQYAPAWSHRAAALHDLNQFVAALECYDRALAINPDDVESLFERSQLQWLRFQRAAPAILDLERVLALDESRAYARGDLLHLRMQTGDWKNLDRDIAALHHGVRACKRVVTPFVYQSIADSPVDLQTCANTYARDRFPAALARWTSPGPAHGKIRVGYLSGEFYEQATAFLTVGLYELHDKSRFEIVAFDNGLNDKGPTRQRIDAAFNKIIDISSMTDGTAADAILGENIDILVNLNGYFGQGRMGVFARKPAPIQVNYLGFPGTLGADYMDYILADPVVISPDEHQYFNEKVVTLPNTYQATDSKRQIAEDIPSRRACGLPEAGFVFCNFNQSYKLTPETFAVWMRLLRGVDDSVLWLWESNTTMSQNLRDEASRHGIAPTRLVFAPGLPHRQHLARLKNADLFLDTLPYNAHTGASDALWAGVPLITCTGTAFAGRVATSLLRAVGLPDLVTENLGDYEKLALKLARDASLLRSVRERLEQNRTTYPLFDTGRFCRNLEAAYKRMVEIHTSGEFPRGFSVT